MGKIPRRSSSILRMKCWIVEQRADVVPRREDTTNIALNRFRELGKSTLADEMNNSRSASYMKVTHFPGGRELIILT